MGKAKPQAASRRGAISPISLRRDAISSSTATAASTPRVGGAHRRSPCAADGAAAAEVTADDDDVEESARGGGAADETTGVCPLSTAAGAGAGVAERSLREEASACECGASPPGCGSGCDLVGGDAISDAMSSPPWRRRDASTLWHESLAMRSG